MSEPETIAGDTTSSSRFRIRRFHVFCIISVGLAAAVYWLSSLTSGAELHMYERLVIRLNIPLGGNEVRSESETRLRAGGDKLKTIIQERLQKEGFVKSGSLDEDNAVLFSGSYRGSPGIELRLSEGISVDEGVMERTPRVST